MRYRKYVLLALIIIPVAVFLDLYDLARFYAGEMEDAEVIGVFMANVFNTGVTETNRNFSLIDSVFGTAPGILCTFLFGTYIYGDLNLRGMYYFIRFKSRRKWLAAQTALLLLSVTLCSSLYIIVNYVMALFVCDNRPCEMMPKVLVYSIFVHTTYNMLAVFTVNFLAIILGSMMSFFAVFSGILVSFLMSYEVYYLYPEKINSICRFFPTEATFADQEAYPETWKEFLSYNNRFAESSMINLIYIVLIFIIAMVLINEAEIGLSDKEMDV